MEFHNPSLFFYRWKTPPLAVIFSLAKYIMATPAQAMQLAKVILDVVPTAMRTIKTQMRAAGKNTLTVPQFRVLNRLANGAMSNQELSDWMGVSAPTMSKIVDNLVLRHLVSRKTEREDRRQVTLECTRQGHSLSNSIRKSVQKELARRISLLPQTKRMTLETGLLVLKETFL